MTDLLLQAWVAALIERTKVEWMLGRRQILEAGRASETAFRRATTATAIPARMCAWRRCCGRCGKSWAPRTWN